MTSSVTTSCSHCFSNSFFCCSRSPCSSSHCCSSSRRSTPPARQIRPYLANSMARWGRCGQHWMNSARFGNTLANYRRMLVGDAQNLLHTCSHDCVSDISRSLCVTVHMPEVIVVCCSRARIGASSADFGPESAKCGRTLAHLGQFWTMLANIERPFVNFGQTSAKFGKSWPKPGGQSGPKIWPASTNTGNILAQGGRHALATKHSPPSLGQLLPNLAEI